MTVAGRTAGRRGRTDGAVAAALAAILLSACVADRTAGLLGPAPAGTHPRPEAGTRPPSGDDHAKLVAAFGGEIRAPAAERLLASVTERLVRATDRPNESFAITILDSPAVNAFALPSGRLYVTRGLLALANDTSEIAGVLAHEIAHVSLRHAAARMELALRSALVTRVVEDVLRDPDGGAEFKSRSQVAFASFSRNQELEADQVGVRTLVGAGFDPYGAVRFLESLNRNAAFRATALGDPGGAPDMLATHPGTPERIALATQAARRAGAPGLAAGDRAGYLSAMDGLAYGESPADGVIRGRRFLQARLGVALEAPEEFVLENAAGALVGGTLDGRRRLLFDALEARADQSLEEVLRSTWNDAVETGTVESTSVNGYPAALATSRGQDWTFRLAIVRIGESTFRLVVAGRAAIAPDPAFRHALASIRALGPEEARALRPLRIAVVTAGPGDTVESLGGRMAGLDRPVERFRTLNGLERGTPQLTAGEAYKLVVE